MISPEHADALARAAISPELAEARGIRTAFAVSELPLWAQDRPWADTVLPAVIFPWLSRDGRRVEQVRPDIPLIWDGGEIHKYMWPTGESSILNEVVPVGDETSTVLIVEGTKQCLAAGSWAPAGVAVYGIGGCRNWSSEGLPIEDLAVCAGRDVVILLDADVRTNLDVYRAAKDLGEVVAHEGGRVKYGSLPGVGGSNGLDDVLGARPASTRTEYLTNVIKNARRGKPAEEKPKPKKAAVEEGEGPAFFDAAGGLRVQTLSETIRGRYPAALTEERLVALYRDGVYHVDGMALKGAVAELLGERSRPGHRAAAEEFTAATLFNAGLFLPMYVDDALLNVPNGMLDLATSTLKPHDPAYFSSSQIPIGWDPDARCPAYEAWVEKCGIADQIDDLEESAAAMLDPSVTPQKAVFLFGPSRSGKSTFLRLMQRVAGARNVSAVTLHQLSQNRFAAANVFGKILNCAADLSAAHVEDISIFKMMTGEDPIQADRKYGGQFAFVNRALFAFSANELPTVGESSRAYVERIKPFEFPISFAGRERPGIEKDMAHELPGILARWVRAWQRRNSRGHALATSPAVLREFETRSDRVRQWLDEKCVIWTEHDGKPVTPGRTLPPAVATAPRALAQAFNDWAKENQAHGMGQRKILDRLATVTGVVEVRVLPSKSRAFNITVRHDDDDAFKPQDPFGGDQADQDPSGEGGSYEGPSGSYEGSKVPLVAVTEDQTATDSAEVRGEEPSGVAEVAVSSLTTNPTHSTRDEMGLKGVEGSFNTRVSPRLGVGLETATSATSATDTLFTPPTPLKVYERATVLDYTATGSTDLPEGVLSLDIETGSQEDIWSTGPEFVRLVGYQKADRIVVSPDPWDLAGEIAKARVVVGHNVMAFDLIAYARNYGVDLTAMAEAGQVFDTKLVSILSDPPTPGMTQGQIQRDYSLDNLGAKLFDQKKTGDLKALAAEFGGYDRIPVDDVRYVRYLIGDVDLGSRLGAHLTDGYRRNAAYWKREHRVAAVAAQMRTNGFKIDTLELARRVEANQADRSRRLADLSGRYGLPTTKKDGKPSKSPHATADGKAAIARAFADLGVTLPPTPSGEPGFGKVALEGVAQDFADNTDVMALAELVGGLNGVRTVYETLAQYTINGRVHPEVAMFQASGRWSTTKPGLTVLGKRAGKYREREVLVADEGQVIIAADLSQVDARALAALSQDPAYIAMFAPGLDLHKEIARRIWGDESRREEAKALGHGWNYGLGIAGMVRNANVPEETARRFDRGMREQFPRLVEWREGVRAAGEAGELLDNGFGRPLRVDPTRAYTQAPALMGQGCARDLMMEGLLRLPREVLPMLRAVVHDEVVMSVPIADVEEVERVVLDALSFDWAPPGAALSIRIEAGLGERRGRNWGEVYAK